MSIDFYKISSIQYDPDRLNFSIIALFTDLLTFNYRIPSLEAKIIKPVYGLILFYSYR